jgi:hypothetical protein
MDVVTSQVIVDDLRHKLKGLKLSSPSCKGSDFVDILRRTPDGFSLATLTHEIVQFLKCSTDGDDSALSSAIDLIGLLVKRFGSSFRPQARDVMSMLVALGRREHPTSSVLEAYIQLLHYSIRNQMGNPRIVFTLIATEFLPWVSTMGGLVSLKSVSVVLRQLFSAPSNRQCLVAYVKSGVSDKSEESIGRKRKSEGRSGDVYVSSLFESLRGCDSVSVFQILLREFSSAESTSGFLFFKHLMNTVTNDMIRISLWREIAALRIYQFRGDQSEDHRKELVTFFETTTPSWELIEAVLEIDPIYFTDKAIEMTFSLLPETTTTTESSTRCLSSLFGVHARKGLLSVFVQSVIEQNDIFISQDLNEIVRSVINDVSPQDLVGVFQSLIARIGSEITVIRLLAGFVEFGTTRLTENFFSRATDLFVAGIESAVRVSEKNARNHIATLVISLVDGLRNVYLSQLPPMQAAESRVVETIEHGLNWVAAKSSRRCDALIRLAGLCNVSVSADDIRACTGWSECVSAFTSGPEGFMNRIGLSERIPGLVPSIVDTRPDADTKSIDFSTIESVISGVDNCMHLHSEVIFTPPSLRGASFPREVTQLEAAIGTLATDAVKCVEARLNTHPTSSLYIIAVALEALKRGSDKPKNTLPNELLSTVMNGLFAYNIPKPLIARLVLAVHPYHTFTTAILLQVSLDLVGGTRDQVTVDCAYFALFQALSTGRDKRRVRLPWWTSQMFFVIACVRGLVGACIDAVTDEVKVASAHYVVRVWKLISESFATVKMEKVSKSLILLLAEYVRFGSGRITHAQCLHILDRGACALIGKLTKDEREHCMALLGNSLEKESLRRINEVYEKKFKFTGKV